MYNFHHIVNIAKKVRRTFHKPRWYVFLFVLLYFWLVEFFETNINAILSPPTSTTFTGIVHDQTKCLQDLESLIIAAEAYPYTYSNITFGIPETFSRLRGDVCNQYWPAKSTALSPKYVQQLKTWSEEQYSQLTELSWPTTILLPRYDKRIIGSIELSSFYAPSTLGHVWRLISQYPVLYSGEGIIHYIRCDYSLNTKPYHTFLLSAIHNNPENLSDKTRERIDECDAREKLMGEIEEALRTSALLPIQLQDKN